MDITLPLLDNVAMVWGDYNNDGFPDLAVSGRTRPDLEAVTILFRNEAGHDLVQTDIVLPQVRTGLAWGDYDQDGDLDLATSAGTLLRNQGGTNFVNSGITLLGGQTYNRSVSWADVDNDGLIDLEINGIINLNLGGNFEAEDPLNPPTVGCFDDIPPVWHDYNGDGLLDAAAQGRIYLNRGYRYTPGYPEYSIPDRWRLWLESGDDVFPNWSSPSLSAGDFNNDGYLDLALSGMAGSSSDVRFSVFRQEPTQAFTDIGLKQDGFYGGGAGWCDWDGDGDLDLLAGGFDSTFEPHLASLANRLADRGKPNTPPQAPTHFETSLIEESLLLRWHPATDKETPEPRLGYEVRVGRSPGSVDVVSPYGLGPLPGNARLIGALNLPENPVYYQTFLNTEGLPGIRLRNLSPGRYYWSVRTVDGAQARSPWSGDQAFTITASGLRTGDVNLDGKVDVADLVRIRKMVAGAVAPDVEKADMNSDGIVNEADALVVANMVLGIDVDSFLPAAEAEIGPAGGVLTDGLFTLTVPAGAFPETVQVQLSVTADDPVSGGSSPRLLWRIDGLPGGMTGALTLTGPDLRASPTTDVSMLLGQWVRPHGVNDDTMAPIRTFSSVPGAVINGKLVTEIPADLLFGAAAPVETAPAAAGRASTSDKWKFSIDAGWLWDSYNLATSHFVIQWDGVAPSYVVALGQELEGAFDFYQAKGYAFADKRDWKKYPVQVYLKPISDEGGEVHTSDNGAYIQLNIESMKRDELRRSTVYHELFHLVQGLVNPAYAVTEAFDKNLLVVAEATATWLERFGANAPDIYVPQNYDVRKLCIFDGLSYGARVNAGHTGYALSSMIEYIANQYYQAWPEQVVKAIYDCIVAGDNPVTAVFNAVPDLPGKWHHDYYRSAAQREIYPNSPIVNLPLGKGEWPAAHNTYTYSGKTGEWPVTTFAPHLPGLGADGYRFAFTKDAVDKLTDKSVLAVSLSNDRNDMGLSVISAQIAADPVGTIQVESYGTQPETLRMRVRDLKAALPTPPSPRAPWRSFIALVSRTDLSEPDTIRPAILKMAVAEQLNGAYPLTPFTHGDFRFQGEIVPFPEYTITSSMNLSDLTGIYEASASESAPGVNTGDMALLAFQDGQILAPFAFSAADPASGSYRDVFDRGSNTDFYRITYKSTEGYKIWKRRYLGPELNDQPYVFEPRSFSGSETLTLESNEDHVYFGISIHYTVEADHYTLGVPDGWPSSFHTSTTPVFIHLIRE